MERYAFFDIETTGLSADTTYLYLIGCVYYKDSSFHLIQWFSEEIREEVQLITSFFQFLKNYDILIHFNGTSFDIPYLLRKCHSLNLDFTFDQVVSLDLFKKISPYKKLLQLQNYRQKTIEAFLHVKRKDTLGGEELIQIYAGYLGKKRLETLRSARNANTPVKSASEADELLHLLFLHNEDDIKGLVSICSILNYEDMFEKPIRIIQAGVEDELFSLQFELTSPLPIRVNFGNTAASITACDKTAILTVSIYQGELKYFYENYKDYFYLPQEDSVVHKSIAQFVEKEFKEKAKPSNCYTKKQGMFVPQYEAVIIPSFKHSYTDKVSFLEIHTDFLLKEENLELYAKHMLHHLLKEK
jgi:uncharacterized protein YprB with RNaseH-like and TPR domain